MGKVVTLKKLAAGALLSATVVGIVHSASHHEPAMDAKEHAPNALLYRKINQDPQSSFYTKTIPLGRTAFGSKNTFQSFFITGRLGYKSMCFYNDANVKQLCVIGNFPTGSNIFTDEIKDEDRNEVYGSFSFIKNVAGTLQVSSVEHGPGFAVIDLYPETELKGQRLCSIELQVGRAESVCSGATSAKSAMVRGFKSGAQLCFRSTLDEINRCYHSKPTDRSSPPNSKIVINDIDNSADLEIFFVTTKGGRLSGKLYRIDYTDL